MSFKSPTVFFSLAYALRYSDSTFSKRLLDVYSSLFISRMSSRHCLMRTRWCEIYNPLSGFSLASPCNISVFLFISFLYEVSFTLVWLFLKVSPLISVSRTWLWDVITHPRSRRFPFLQLTTIFCALFVHCWWAGCFWCLNQQLNSC